MHAISKSHKLLIILVYGFGIRVRSFRSVCISIHHRTGGHQPPLQAVSLTAGPNILASRSLRAQAGIPSSRSL